jgi:predicted amidohydrolase YtcJ
VSFNSDRPIVGGDPWDGIRTAANRPEGFSPMENCTEREALLAYTSGGGQANRDPGMGSLEPGAVADFQVLPS